MRKLKRESAVFASSPACGFSAEYCLRDDVRSESLPLFSNDQRGDHAGDEDAGNHGENDEV